MEYARHVLGIRNAAHAEYEAEAETLIITPVACAVAGRPAGAPRLSGKLRIRIASDSLAFRTYQQAEVAEEYTCNYELNSRFQAALEAGGLRVSGRGENGEARMVELPDHRFFLASLFLPQLASEPGNPHPVVREYLKAALKFKGQTSLKGGG